MSGFSLSQAIGQGPLTEEKEAAPSGVEKEKDSEKDATAAGGKEEETGAGSVQPTLGEMTDVDRFARLLSKLHCDRCQKDVSSAVRICCVESSDVDLCVDCFSKGAEKGDHKPWHKYVPLERLNYPLFRDEPDWTAEEELNFIQQIGKCGFGHWTEIGEQLPSKNVEDLFAHYSRVFLDSATRPLPDFSKLIGVGTSSEEEKTKDASSSSSSSAAGPPAAAASVAPTEIGGGGDEVGRVGVSGSGGGQQSGGTMGGGEGDVEMGTEGSVAAGGGGGGGGGAPHRAESSASVSSSSAAIVPTGAARSGSSSASVTGGPEGAGAQSQKQPDAKPPSYSIVGYMERRCDFETEYDNDAEMIVADLEFRPEEPPEETELKLNALEIFNCKLDERMRRKAFAVHRNLLDIRAQQAKDRKRTRDERDYHQILRAAQRFHPDVEHEEFVKCLITERRLRERAEKLREWRQKGIRTFREAAELESIGQAREVQNKKPTYSSNQTSSSTNAFTFHPEKEVVTALKKTGRKWVMDQEEIDAVGGVGRRGKGDTMTAHSQTHTEGQGEGEGDTEGGGRGGGILGRSGHSSLGSVDESMGLGLGGEGEGEGGEGVEAPGEGGEERDAGAPKEMQFGPQDEYSILPGWDLLDENEKKVSSRLQIPPQHFLSMKKMIVDAQISLGFLTQSETHKVFKMDTSRAGELYEFGVSARLIERPTEGNAAAADAVEAAEKAEKEKEKADKKAAAAQAAAIAGADKDKIIAGAQQPPPSKLRRV